jgi:hypothetical protein
LDDQCRKISESSTLADEDAKERTFSNNDCIRVLVPLDAMILEGGSVKSAKVALGKE